MPPARRYEYRLGLLGYDVAAYPRLLCRKRSLMSHPFLRYVLPMVTTVATLWLALAASADEPRGEVAP